MCYTRFRSIGPSRQRTSGQKRLGGVEGWWAGARRRTRRASNDAWPFHTEADLAQIHDLYSLRGPALSLNLQPHYNGAPAQDFAACRVDEDGNRVISQLRWGSSACLGKRRPGETRAASMPGQRFPTRRLQVIVPDHHRVSRYFLKRDKNDVTQTASSEYPESSPMAWTTSV